MRRGWKAMAVGAVMLTALSGAPVASASVATTKGVAVKDYFFSPKAITIVHGTFVKWTNFGKHTHTTTNNGGLWNVTLKPGQTYTRQFNKVSFYKYHCNIHPSMTGTIKVT